MRRLSARRYAGGLGGSVSSIQSSIPSITGWAAVRVVRVRFLLGENQTYSTGASAGSGDASISGPDTPLSLRSSRRWRLASCLAFRASSLRRRSPRYIAGRGAIIVSSHHGTDDPRRELLFPHSAQLALRALARRHRDHFLEDLPPHGLDRRPLEDHAAVDVHVLLHVPVHDGVRRKLNGGHGLAAEDGPAARREADDVGAARDETRDGDRIGPGGVHEDETPSRDRLPARGHGHH